MLKSIFIDEDIHRYVKILSAEQNKSIKFLICEALIELFKKYNKEIPVNLKEFYERQSNM